MGVLSPCWYRDGLGQAPGPPVSQCRPAPVRSKLSQDLFPALIEGAQACRADAENDEQVPAEARLDGPAELPGPRGKCQLLESPCELAPHHPPELPGATSGTFV